MKQIPRWIYFLILHRKSFYVNFICILVQLYTCTNCLLFLCFHKKKEKNIYVEAVNVTLFESTNKTGIVHWIFNKNLVHVQHKFFCCCCFMRLFVSFVTFSLNSAFFNATSQASDCLPLKYWNCLKLICQNYLFGRVKLFDIVGDFYGNHKNKNWIKITGNKGKISVDGFVID